MQLNRSKMWLVLGLLAAWPVGCADQAGGIILAELRGAHHDWSDGSDSTNESPSGPGSTTTDDALGTAGPTGASDSDPQTITAPSGDDTTGTASSGTQTTESETAELPDITPVRIDVTTVSSAGEFAPRNSGAIWVETGAGEFVRTLKLWADKRKRHLIAWNQASMGSSVDAMTSATLKAHTRHELTWDGTDLDGIPVAPGRYRLRVEAAENNGAGPAIVLDFELGAGPFALHPTDLPGFTAIFVTSPPDQDPVQE